jgi:hypothetical protein
VGYWDTRDGKGRSGTGRAPWVGAGAPEGGQSSTRRRKGRRRLEGADEGETVSRERRGDTGGWLGRHEREGSYERETGEWARRVARVHAGSELHTPL